MTENTIIITGGSRGMGASISAAFHAAGHRVVIAGRTDTGLAKQLGEHARFIATDVRQTQSLVGLIKRTIDWTGRLDVLVNNAGLSAWRPLGEIDEAFWQDMLDTNLKSVLFASQAALPHMRRGGSIINISSLAGKRGSTNNSVYCATKFGVNAITQSLAKELGPVGIRVNAVGPGFISTDLVKNGLPPETYDMLAGMHPIGRMGTPEEVAKLVLFLASDASSNMTGGYYPVDGGYTIR